MQPVVFLLRYVHQQSEGSHPAALSRIWLPQCHRDHRVTSFPGSREPGVRFHVGGSLLDILIPGLRVPAQQIWSDHLESQSQALKSENELASSRKKKLVIIRGYLEDIVLIGARVSLAC
jgi:hypothetical protein